jgi:hypothetical protein
LADVSEPGILDNFFFLFFFFSIGGKEGKDIYHAVC